MTTRRHRVPAAMVTGLLHAAALVALRPHPAELALHLEHPQRWVAEIGTDRAVITSAGAALWVVAAWIAVGVLATAAGRLPGATGSAARRVAAVTLPRTLYRLIAGAAGLGVLLSPAAALASTPNPDGTSSTLPAPRPPIDSVATPRWPTMPDPTTVSVRSGDSLWRIAAAALPPDASPARIAAAWPRWFAANRAVIGANPDYLVPGEVLHAPEDPQ